MAETEIYTIGHSNHPIEHFLELLLRHQVRCLVDVRTYPSSRQWPQFNGPCLRDALGRVGLDYCHVGQALGGRPGDPALHTRDGLPDYDRIEASEAYQAGIDALCDLARHTRVALMCGEADYRRCHRERLIARTLRARGIIVWHILADGTVTQEPQGTLLEARMTYLATLIPGCEPA